MKIGLYFGSFNPIHNGHLIIANHILNETGLNKIWFVVSPQNPLKQSTTLLHSYDRLHLVSKAIENDNRMKASDIEFHLPKPSYSATTLAYLKEKYPEHDFSIIMGSDSFQNLVKWKNYQTIIENNPLIIYKRPGFDITNNIGAQLTIMNAPLLEISATYIRELVKKSKSIKYLVPEAIEEEVQNNRFYSSKQIPE
jgi:nicotinate-nucleotide adenylyltransferase